MNASPLALAAIPRWWNQFFYAPRDPTICAVIRIGFSILLLINVLVWLPDLELWFSESGLVPFAVSRSIVDSDTLTLLSWIPKTSLALWICYGIFVTHIVLLLVGWFTRLQAACVFVWLFSFQHRNIILFDGEDTVFRLFCFFLILCPAGCAYSIDAWRNQSNKQPNSPPWALRLFQIQMSIIYLSTGLEKANGADWENGTALYYVARLDDLFGKFWVPDFIFESMFLVKILSWGTLAFELVIPFALWFKETRRTALVIAIFFHLATDYAMNLFLFHWIMLLGLLSFCEPQDWRKLRQWGRTIWKVVARRR